MDPFKFMQGQLVFLPAGDRDVGGKMRTIKAKQRGTVRRRTDNGEAGEPDYFVVWEGPKGVDLSVWFKESELEVG